jgi:NADP-dependent 3-hydroxy acid dehydrogenase YdfG
MNDRFKGKVVVVTGASAGVGRAAATAFAKHGARVALIARGEESLESARRRPGAHGSKARSGRTTAPGTPGTTPKPA